MSQETAEAVVRECSAKKSVLANQSINIFSSKLIYMKPLVTNILWLYHVCAQERDQSAP